MLDHNALYIHTDGSSLPSPRKGGIGMRFVFPDCMDKEELDFAPEGYVGGTSSQMELKACIVALQQVLKFNELQQVSRIIIKTDSRYVVDNYKRAINFWSKNGWYRNTGAPVLNVKYWKDLIKNMQKVYKKFYKIVEIEWEKGHSKSEHNKEADKLAKQSAKNATKRLPGFVNVRRKRSGKSVKPGSVKMLGQKITIRIISSEYLKQQQIWRYKYEVISKGSKFYENVDWIYYHEPLRQRFTYLVSLNKNNDYPRISKVLHKTL